MFQLYLTWPEIDEQGNPTNNDPVFLWLTYAQHSEAVAAKDKLEELYGKGRISIEQCQEYGARMGRY